MSAPPYNTNDWREGEPMNRSHPINPNYNHNNNNTSNQGEHRSLFNSEHDKDKGPDVVTVPNNHPMYNNNPYKSDKTNLAAAGAGAYGVGKAADPYATTTTKTDYAPAALPAGARPFDTSHYCCGFSKRTWCIFGIILLLLVIAAAVLIAFLVRVPDVSYDRASFNCSPADCVSRASAGSLPIAIYFVVNNPNIIGADISGPVTVYGRDRTSKIGTGFIPEQHINARDKTEVAVNLNVLNSPASTEAAKTVFIDNKDYPIFVEVPLEIKYGALHPTYTIEREEVIPAQGDKIPDIPD